MSGEVDDFTPSMKILRWDGESVCETRDEKIRFLQGKLRKDLRGRQREERETIEEEFYAATDEELDRLMSAPTLL